VTFFQVEYNAKLIPQENSYLFHFHTTVVGRGLSREAASEMSWIQTKAPSICFEINSRSQRNTIRQIL